MKKQTYRFTNAPVDYYFDGSMGQLRTVADPVTTVVITDEHVYKAHAKKFSNWNTIVLKPGEAFKNQTTVDAVIEQLIEMGADRSFTLVGVGGGVVTDLTGYVASVYMRGIRFGFIPTTVLAMVDASIGGKNGVDVGVYKNMVGIIRQPSFLLFDISLLKSLPEGEWVNGFAEIIKHACIKDAVMFQALEANSINKYRKSKEVLLQLIRRNTLLKTKVVQQDEFETGDRKLLNFGHTLGHAIENIYELSHGQAISIGMTYACHISEPLTGFRATSRVTQLLNRYGLPTYAAFDKKKAFEILQKDKKKVKTELSYVLLQKLGKGVIQNIPLHQLETIIEQL